MYSTVNSIFHLPYFVLDYPTSGLTAAGLARAYCAVFQYSDGEYNGFDLRRNLSAAWELAGRYATDVFTDEAVRIIQGHDASPLGPPLFLYLAHLAVQAGNPGKLLEAPQQEINKFRHIGDPNRRTYAGNGASIRHISGLEYICTKATLI
jgi:hypothetical protein